MLKKLCLSSKMINIAFLVLIFYLTLLKYKFKKIKRGCGGIGRRYGLKIR